MSHEPILAPSLSFRERQAKPTRDSWNAAAVRNTTSRLAVGGCADRSRRIRWSGILAVGIILGGAGPMLAQVTGSAITLTEQKAPVEQEALGRQEARGEQEALGEQKARGARETLGVMSFNIRFNNPGDGPNAWPHRRDFVAEVIQHADVDVVGLQEALHGQIQDLEQRMPGFAWFGVGRDDGEQAGEFVPIFYRRDRCEKLAGGHFWLSETPAQPGSRSWDAAITRMVTWLKLKDQQSGCAFLVANTHFDHVGAQARLESAKLIRRRLPEIAGELPVILLGDFNCLNKDAPYQALVAAGDQASSPALFDARERSQQEPVGPDSTWSGFRAVQPGRRIDFVFVNSEWKVTQHRTWDRTKEGRFPSDHLPVSVQLRLSP